MLLSVITIIVLSVLISSQANRLGVSSTGPLLTALFMYVAVIGAFIGSPLLFSTYGAALGVGFGLNLLLAATLYLAARSWLRRMPEAEDWVKRASRETEQLERDLNRARSS